MRIVDQKYPLEYRHPAPRVDEEQIKEDRTLSLSEKFYVVCELSEFVMELSNESSNRGNGRVLLKNPRPD